MKSLLAILLFCGFNFSVSASEKPGSHFCLPNTTQISCQLELALVCGAGYKDGCLTRQSNVHKCVLQPNGSACSAPVQLLCISGLRDGCETGRSTRHQCLPYVGPLCDSGEAFSCPEGFLDTCNL